MALLIPTNVVFLPQHIKTLCVSSSPFNPLPCFSVQCSSGSSKNSAQKTSSKICCSKPRKSSHFGLVQSTHIIKPLEDFPNGFDDASGNPTQILQQKVGRNLLVGFMAFCASPFVSGSEKAFAIDGQYGLLEGRSASLIHPIVMGGLFVFTLWTGYLGWQWRRIRTIQYEINELKKKPLVAAAAEAQGDQPPPPPSPEEAKIQQLTEERKRLLKGSYRDRHYNSGSILLAFGVFEAIGGCINTYFRTGKLFPGPHLFSGAGITLLWAWAAALVPEMQRGNEVARSLHISLNAINVLLFISQIPTGIDIVLKVLEFTKWP